MASADRRSDEEAFEQGFLGIPDPHKRAKMSPEKLAIELSKQEKDSPPYILLEHELNLRLAKEQSMATLEAGRYGGHAAILSAILTALIGYWLGSSLPHELTKPNTCPAISCNCTSQASPAISDLAGSKVIKDANGNFSPRP